MGIAERRQSEKDARINLILDSAAAIFRKKGFQDSTIEDIAAHAEISKGIIYYYFKSKSDLYLCLVQPALEKLLECLTNIAEDKQDEPDHRIKRFARAVYEFYTNNKDAYYLITKYNDEEYSKLLPVDRLDRYRHMMRGTLGQCEVVIKDGIDKGIFKDINSYAAAEVFLGSFMGMMQFQENRMKQGKKDYREEMLGYMQIIVDGLRSK